MGSIDTGGATDDDTADDDGGDPVEIRVLSEPAELRRLVAAAGFVDVEVIEFPDGAPAGEDADRVWVVARRP